VVKIICGFCFKELQELGGLLFSPPIMDLGHFQATNKTHLCFDCYERIVNPKEK